MSPYNRQRIDGSLDHTIFSRNTELPLLPASPAPRLTGERLFVALTEAGFEAVRIRGSPYFPGIRMPGPLGPSWSEPFSLFSSFLRDLR